MDALVGKTDEPAGPEWFKVDEFASRYGYSSQGADKRLRVMFNAGQIEKWRGYSQSSRRHIIKYRVKQPEKKKELQRAR